MNVITKNHPIKRYGMTFTIPFECFQIGDRFYAEQNFVNAKGLYSVNFEPGNITEKLIAKFTIK